MGESQIFGVFFWGNFFIFLLVEAWPEVGGWGFFYFFLKRGLKCEFFLWGFREEVNIWGTRMVFLR